ncbi:hypothetical protein MferCBS31731_002307 [Microsporum ferrugineum]
MPSPEFTGEGEHNVPRAKFNASSIANSKGANTASTPGRLACDICRESKCHLIYRSLLQLTNPTVQGKSAVIGQIHSADGVSGLVMSVAIRAGSDIVWLKLTFLASYRSFERDWVGPPQAEALLSPLRASIPTPPTVQNQHQQPQPIQLELAEDPVVFHDDNNPGTMQIDYGNEGFDLLVNLTNDIPDFWNYSGLDLSAPIPSPEEAGGLPQLLDLLGTPYSNPSSQLQSEFGIYTSPIDKHWVEKEISTQDMVTLHYNFFEYYYPVLPILSQSRFRTELNNNPASLPIRALSYGVALIGTTVSSRFNHLQQVCYTAARKYVELCERDEDETLFMNLNTFQALVFIIRYELTKSHLTRAWMTLRRAIALAGLLNLHELDSETTRIVSRFEHSSTSSPSSLRAPTSSTRKPIRLEEMRRSFWALYVFEGYASVRMNKACLLDEDNLQIRLPSPGQLTDDFVPSPTIPFLGNPERLRAMIHLVSPFSAIVIMVKLARWSYKHVYILSIRPTDEGFWDRHYRLVKMISDYTAIFQDHLSAAAVREDPLAFSLHTNLCATHIYLHEAAIQKVEDQELPKLVAAESKKCSTAAALKILSAIRMNWPAQRSERDFFTLQATFLGHPLATGMKALTRCLQESGDAASINIVDALRLLRAALDQVEEPEGYWHITSMVASTTLEKWDNKQGGFNTGS